MPDRTTKNEGSLGDRELAYISHIVSGIRDSHRQLDRAWALTALGRAILRLQTESLELAASFTTTDTGQETDPHSALELILAVLENSSPRAAAWLATRMARRLQPIVSSVAGRLPANREPLRVIEEALRRSEAFASGQADSVAAVETADVQIARSAISEASVEYGEQGEDYGGKGRRLALVDFWLRMVGCVYAFSREPVKEGRFDLFQMAKECVEQLHGGDILRAAAVDAAVLIRTGLDAPEAVARLIPSQPVVPLAPLWPGGEPGWYLEEVARMPEAPNNAPPADPKDEAVCPEEHDSADEAAETIRVPHRAFFRTMAVLLWSALRYPFRTTEVDLVTGRVVRRY